MKQSKIVIEPIEPQAFIESAMVEFMGDVQLAQVALVRGATDSVRDLATHIIDDGKRMLADIAGIAARRNLRVPDTLDQEQESVLRGMREENGEGFDAAYIERLALHHRHAIKLFARGQAIKIPEISALASRALAIIEARIKLSRRLSGSIDSLLEGRGAGPPGTSPDPRHSRI